MEVVGELLELSETGASVSLEGVQGLPCSFKLEIISESGLCGTVDAEAVHIRETAEGRLLVGACFAHVAPAQRTILLRQMFSEPNAWLHDRFPADRPMLAALSVVLAPWRALFARWHGRDSLVEALAVHRPTPGPDRWDVPRRVGVAAALAAAAFATLTIHPNGGRPTEQMATAIGLERVGIAAAPRHVALLSTLSELRSLSRVVRAATWSAAAVLDPRWDKHLWGLGYALVGGDVNADPLDDAARTELLAAETDLGGIVAHLRAGESASELRYRLDSLDARLAAVEAQLSPPPTPPIADGTP